MRKLTILKRLIQALLLLLLLAGATELFLRLAGWKPALTYGDNYIRDLTPPSGPVRLLDPAPFVTSDDGLWVAHSSIPGVLPEGFRTFEFEFNAGERKSVMFIGDGFAWGLGAQPISDSVVDRVRAAGYKTINLGVPGVGTAQYLALAEKYVPQLRPDAVCVLFNMANDFDWEPPVLPGKDRYYPTDVGLLPGTRRDGAPLEAAEAIQGYEALYAARPVAMMKRALMRTALGSHLLDTAGVEVIKGEEDEETVRQRLERIRDICSENGAQFFLFLIPVRDQYRNASTTLARGETLFEALEPDALRGFTDEHFVQLPGSRYSSKGHARYADFIVDELATAGLEPRPDDPMAIAAADRAALDLRPSWDWFRATLELNDQQADLVLAEVNGLKQDFHDIFIQDPEDGEPSPLQHLANLIREGGSDRMSEYRDAFARYASEKTFPGSDKSYFEQYGEFAQRRYTAVEMLLDDSQRRLMATLPITHNLDIDTGFDPFSLAIARLSGEGAPLPGTQVPDEALQQKYPFDSFAEQLKLTPDQREAARAIIDAAKQDLANIFSEPAEEGVSPAEYLARMLAENLPEEERNESLREYASTQISAKQGLAYFRLFEKASEQRLRELYALLDEEQQHLLGQVPVDSITKIDTGADPLGEAVAAFLQQTGGAENGRIAWRDMAEQLQLTQEEITDIEQELNALKDALLLLLRKPATSGAEAPADHYARKRAAGEEIELQDYVAALTEAESGRPYSELMSEMEDTARSSIYGMLSGRQRRAFEALHSGALSEIATGHEPFDAFVASVRESVEAPQ